MLSHTKFQIEINTSHIKFLQCVQGWVLLTQAYNNNNRSRIKKTVGRPKKTVEKEKKKQQYRQLQSFLRYTQTQKDPERVVAACKV